MRLGGPLFGESTDADSWIKLVKNHGYSAAYCPVSSSASEREAQEYVTAAKENNIVIAEVGAWSNPISPDVKEKETAIQKCKESLAHADRMKAFCCVNIAGARGDKWDGPFADNLLPETFDLIVQTTQEIIDCVKPSYTYYTLEMMPWIFPDSPESYMQLIEAIDRSRFAVHLDPVNIVNSPARYFSTGDLIRKCFEMLGPKIKSCHGKDIILSSSLTVHLDETRPGLGKLDYVSFLTELDKLPVDTPLMLEHLSTAEEYRMAAEYIRSVAENNNITIS